MITQPPTASVKFEQVSTNRSSEARDGAMLYGVQAGRQRLIYEGGLKTLGELVDALVVEGVIEKSV